MVDVRRRPGLIVLVTGGRWYPILVILVLITRSATILKGFRYITDFFLSS